MAEYIITFTSEVFFTIAIIVSLALLYRGLINPQAALSWLAFEKKKQTKIMVLVIYIPMIVICSIAIMLFHVPFIENGAENDASLGQTTAIPSNSGTNLRVGLKVFTGDDGGGATTQTICPTIDAYHTAVDTNDSASLCLHEKPGILAIVEEIIPGNINDSDSNGVPYVKLRSDDDTWSGYASVLPLKTSDGRNDSLDYSSISPDTTPQSNPLLSTSQSDVSNACSDQNPDLNLLVDYNNKIVNTVKELLRIFDTDVKSPMYQNDSLSTYNGAKELYNATWSAADIMQGRPTLKNQTAQNYINKTWEDFDSFNNKTSDIAKEIMSIANNESGIISTESDLTNNLQLLQSDYDALNTDMNNSYQAFGCSTEQIQKNGAYMLDQNKNLSNPN